MTINWRELRDALLARAAFDTFNTINPTCINEETLQSEEHNAVTNSAKSGPNPVGHSQTNSVKSAESPVSSWASFTPPGYECAERAAIVAEAADGELRRRLTE